MSSEDPDRDMSIDKSFLGYRRRSTMHPLDWGFLACCILVVSGTLALVLAISSLVAITPRGIVRIRQFWPEVQSDLTELTWARGTNSEEAVKKALADGEGAELFEDMMTITFGGLFSFREDAGSRRESP